MILFQEHVFFVFDNSWCVGIIAPWVVCGASHEGEKGAKRCLKGRKGVIYVGGLYFTTHSIHHENGLN